MMILHTFVLPAFGESPYLEQCIQSLLAQTVKSYVVITTSTPNDFIHNISKKYDVMYFENTNREKGIASDWNFALSKSLTQFVTIAHQDDIYLPHFTETVLEKIQFKEEKILIAFSNYHDLVGTKVKSFTLNNCVKKILLLPFLFKNNIESIFFKKAILAFGDPIGCPTVTFNLTRLQSFSFSYEYHCILDWFAWYNLAAQKGSFLYINKSLMLHRIHGESETTNLIQNGIRKLEERALFNLIWGKRFAKILIMFYSLGHKQNKV